MLCVESGSVGIQKHTATNRQCDAMVGGTGSLTKGEDDWACIQACILAGCHDGPAIGCQLHDSVSTKPTGLFSGRWEWRASGRWNYLQHRRQILKNKQVEIKLCVAADLKQW